MKQLLTFVSLCVFALHAHATYVVPNISKIQRDAHENAATATRTVRKTAGAEYTRTSTETKTDGVKTADVDKTELNPFVFFNNGSGYAVEAEVNQTNTDEDDVASAPKSKETEIKLQGGFIIPNSPVAVGLGISDDKSKDDGSAAQKIRGVQLAANMQLGESMYAAANITRTEFDPGGGGSKIKDIDFYTAGWGFLDGTPDKAHYSFETVLIWQNENGNKSYTSYNDFVLNLNEKSQLRAIGLISYYAVPDSSDGRGLMLAALYDYQINEMFYVAPGLIWGKNIDSGDDDSNDLSLNIEAGIRQANFSVFATLGNDATKTTSPSSTDKTKVSSISLGGQYYF